MTRITTRGKINIVVPQTWHVSIRIKERDNVLINCACCGHKTIQKNMFDSNYLITDKHNGYLICKACHSVEVHKLQLEHRRSSRSVCEELKGIN